MLKRQLQSAVAVLGVAGAIIIFPGTAFPATLLHYYDFSGAVVTDLAGTADGTLFGDATVSGGRLHLDGNGDYVEFGSSIIPGSGTWTVAFYAQQTASQAGIYAEMIASGNQLYIGHNPATQFRFSDNNLSTTVNYPTDGLMHHYAWVQDVSSGTFYIDGSAVGTFNSMAATDVTRLGRQYNGHAEYFLGNMDEVRVYGGTLSSPEIGVLSAVPEPSASVLLLISGILTGGILLARRRSRIA